MRAIYIIFLLLVFFYTSMKGADRLIYGLDTGFSLSNNSWTIGAGPQIGYKLTNKFHIGGGIGYIHGQSKNNMIYKYKVQSVYLDIFAHYHPWKKLIIQLRPEIIHSWYQEKYESEKYKQNKFIPAITVGAGVYLRPVVLMMNYELIQNQYTPYSKSIFLSVGFLL